MSVREALAETVYPSLAATGAGRVCGMLLNLLPLRLGRVRLTHLLFGAVLMPVAPVLYAAQKLMGQRYRLTEAAVEAWPMVGANHRARIELDRIATSEVRVRRGQRFYNAGDVHLLAADGSPLLVLEGVPHPERVQTLVDNLRTAKRQRDAALATIAARSPAAAS